MMFFFHIFTHLAIYFLLLLGARVTREVDFWVWWNWYIDYTAIFVIKYDTSKYTCNQIER